MASSLQDKLQPAPQALVQDGRFQLGTYCTPFRRVNPLEADLGCPSFLNKLQLKEWQHFAIANEQFYVSFAIFDSKRVNLVQVVVYDRIQQEKIEIERLFLGRHFSLPNELWDNVASYNRTGLRIEVHNHLEVGRHNILLSCSPTHKNPRVIGRFICHEPLDEVEPLVVCLPLGEKRAMYSHKGIFPVEGELVIGGRSFTFEKEKSYALADIHKGYYPFEMKWHWATGGGHLEDGTLLGFNLTDNQVKDQVQYNENALWINGKIHLLPPVRFQMNLENIGEPAYIRDEDGLVNLTFVPEVARKVDVNALLLRNRYRGPYGSFRGYITDSHGDKWDMSKMYGMAEDFYLRA